MADIILFDNGTHRNILLEDSGSAGMAVQANQHIIVHNGEAMLLDPGGHKVYSQVLMKTFSALGHAKLRYLFLSHQDPDIVAAINGWLMTTAATAYVSTLWVGFVQHFGLDQPSGQPPGMRDPEVHQSFCEVGVIDGVRRLRQAVEDPSAFVYVHTVHGMGYRFEPIAKSESGEDGVRR